MQPMIAIVRDLVEERDIHHDEIEALEIETFHEPAMLLGDESKWSKELAEKARITAFRTRRRSRPFTAT